MTRDLLREWAKWAELGRDEAERVGESVRNSAVHYIECAILLFLAPYAYARGFDSTIFVDSNELAHALGGVFECGFPLEMAEALSTCYAFEEPWELSHDWAERYANQLTVQLKDLALYLLEDAEFWAQRRAQELLSGAIAKAKSQGAKKAARASHSGRDLLKQTAREHFLKGGPWNSIAEAVDKIAPMLLVITDVPRPLAKTNASRTVRQWLSEYVANDDAAKARLTDTAKAKLKKAKKPHSNIR